MVDRQSRATPKDPMPIEWVMQALSISRRAIFLLEKEGLVEINQGKGGQVLSPAMIDRIQMILTLRNDLGVNMAGVEIILRMRHQLIWYRNRSRASSGDSCIDIDSE